MCECQVSVWAVGPDQQVTGPRPEAGASKHRRRAASVVPHFTAAEGPHLRIAAAVAAAAAAARGPPAVAPRRTVSATRRGKLAIPSLRATLQPILRIHCFAFPLHKTHPED